MPTSAVTQRLRDDLREYARLADAPYDASRVEPVLDVLTGIAPDALMAVRTTTEPVGEREVNVRFMNFTADPTVALRNAGLLEFTGHPLEQVLASVAEAVPVQFGVDVAVGTGVQKIWLALGEMLDIQRISELPGMPEAVRANAGHLTRWGGGKFILVAVDFQGRTMNLYSQLLAPGQLPPEGIGTILRELDFAPASDAELAAVGAHAYTIYRTFSWTNPGVRRICFPRRFSRETFPVHLDPVLERFVRSAPLVGDGAHAFTFYAAYKPDGRYYKVQADYNPRSDDLRLPGDVEIPPTH